ncbi:MAG: hypothetical protein CMJ48_09375 [Planctomycetaceae bacterium]|jgi:hypothetical protein|nr:hypothetical protein [Planctomycetaceae bacterium]
MRVHNSFKRTIVLAILAIAGLSIPAASAQVGLDGPPMPIDGPKPGAASNGDRWVQEGGVRGSGSIFTTCHMGPT